jgi:hypothetical protein
MTSSVVELTTSIVSELSGSTQAPPTKSLSRV